MEHRLRNNILYSVAIGLSGVLYACFYAVGDRVALGIGWTAGSIGYLASFYSAGGLCSTLLGGTFSDRFGKPRIVRIALCFAVLGCLILAWGGLAGLVLAGVFCLGMGVNSNETLSSAILSEANPATATRWMNISQIMFCIGAIGAPVFAVWYSARAPGGTRSLYLILAVLAGLAVVLTSLPALAKAKVPPGAQPRPRQSLNMFSVVRDLPFTLICLMIFVYAGYETVCVAFLKPYLISCGVQDTLAAAAISVFWLFMIAGRVVGGFLGQREPGSILAFCLLFLAGIAALLWGGGPAMKFAGVALVGLGCGPVWPMLYVLGGRRHPGRSGAAFAMMSLFSSCGGVVFPPLVGTLPGNYRVTVALCGALVAVMILLLAAVRAAMGGRRQAG